VTPTDVPHDGADGSTWVLCHGTPLTPSVWDGVAGVLRQVGTVRQPSLDRWGDGAPVVSALAEAVVDGLPRSGPVHLVGHSFGAQVALEAALLAGPRAASLTVVCGRDTPFPPFSAAAQALRSGDPVDVDALLERWFRPDELTEPEDVVVGYARQCVLQADPNRWAQCLDAIAGFDRSRATPTLTIPVHLIAAELDQVSTVGAMRAMARRLPRSRLTIVADAAHMSVFRQPSVLAHLITSGATRTPVEVVR
jgi:pimeloyl-ACP methyl ester carboxylesterase